jgi:hypothetical protein
LPFKGTIAFSDTNVEWHKFQLRDNMQKLFTKSFGAARLEYSTTSDKFEKLIASLEELPAGHYVKWWTELWTRDGIKLGVVDDPISHT